MSDILQNDVIDILSITETKLDPSFPNNQFKIEGFNIIRNDFTQNSGGIMYMISLIVGDQNMNFR